MRRACKADRPGLGAIDPRPACAAMRAPSFLFRLESPRGLSCALLYHTLLHHTLLYRLKVSPGADSHRARVNLSA
jgi:hypothetical protein